MSEIVYTGHGSAFRLPHSEGEHVFPRGVPCSPPAKVAEQLLEREDFEPHDGEAPEPEPTEPEQPYKVRLAGGPQDGKTGETDTLALIPGPDDGEYAFTDFNEDGEAVFEWNEDPERVNAE